MLFLLLLTSAFSGCVTTMPVDSRDFNMEKPEGEGEERGWWYARFFIEWPENTEPYWYIDLLIAKEIVSPVLESHRDRIKFWRFHRRASRDQSGHQFSFIFYSTPETANLIRDSLKSSPTLCELKSRGVIMGDSYDDTSSINKPDIGDTSDENWSVQIKRSWPYYIMGVSRMWLSLISETRKQMPDTEQASSLEGLKSLYRKINDRIDELWKEEGGHALLHHLNAIFGYGPVTIYEKRLMIF